MEVKDYYKILGITDEEKKLQGDDFKKAVSKHFRELSLKYHPDRHVNDTDEEKKAAEEKFKEINEANAVLSDHNKRVQYDNGGGDSLTDFINRMRQQGGFDPFGSPFGFGFGGGFGNHRQAMQRGKDLHISLTISLQDAYNGVSKTIRYARGVKCESCNGTGSSDGKMHKCHYCNGMGMVQETRRQGNMMFTSTHVCEHCNGTGEEPSKKCDKCNGTGIKRETVTETIDIPAGIGNDMTFCVSGGGDMPKGNGIPGDLLVTVHVQEDSYFKVSDIKNIIHYEDVPIKDALLGFKKKFKMLDGTETEITIPECTPDKKAFLMRGKGMPDVNGGTNGDYAVVIRYIYPNKLTDKQKEILKDF